MFVFIIIVHRRANAVRIRGRGGEVPLPLNHHLTETSRKVIENAQAVLIVDQAGWHISNNLVVPANITIPPLQPRSPELNPVENI